MELENRLSPGAFAVWKSGAAKLYGMEKPTVPKTG